QHRNRPCASQRQVCTGKRPTGNGTPRTGPASRPVIVGPRNLDGSKEIKNRPENRSQTTTSPLVVQNPIDWPVGRENSRVPKHARSLCLEKGRAGGRARQPPRP